MPITFSGERERHHQASSHIIGSRVEIRHEMDSLDHEALEIAIAVN